MKDYFGEEIGIGDRFLTPTLGRVFLLVYEVRRRENRKTGVDLWLVGSINPRELDEVDPDNGPYIGDYHFHMGNDFESRWDGKVIKLHNKMVNPTDTLMFKP